MQDDNLLLCGSSLGGYYAMHLSCRFRVKDILINPSLRPYDTLARYVGGQINYKTNEEYLFREEYIGYLRETAQDEDVLKQVPRLLYVYLDEADEVLDSPAAYRFFSDLGIYTRMYSGGNHRFIHTTDMIADLNQRLG